eukprot:UC1_evm2s961
MRIVITGASNGIGACVARLLAKSKGAEHEIFLTGRRIPDLEAVAHDVNAAGSRAGFAAGDVSQEADVTRVHDQAMEFFGGQPADVLIANAGCGAPKLALENVEPAAFDRVMQTNVKGVYLWLRAVLPSMKEVGRGQIVVMSSVAGLRHYGTAATYCASKWAVQGLCGCVRQELKGSGVKLGTVNPGAVDTDWWNDASRGGQVRKKPEAILKVNDVAEAVATLVWQGASSNIETLTLDPTGA